MTDVVEVGRRFAMIPESLLFSPSISSHAKTAWCILNRHAGATGECYPALARISSLMGVSEDTVRRALTELRDSGYVRMKARVNADGTKASNLYVLVWEPSPSRTGAEPGRTGATRHEDAPDRTGAADQDAPVLPKREPSNESQQHPIPTGSDVVPTPAKRPRKPRAKPLPMGDADDEESPVKRALTVASLSHFEAEFGAEFDLKAARFDYLNYGPNRKHVDQWAGFRNMLKDPERNRRFRLGRSNAEQPTSRDSVHATAATPGLGAFAAFNDRAREMVKAEGPLGGADGGRSPVPIRAELRASDEGHRLG